MASVTLTLTAEANSGWTNPSSGVVIDGSSASILYYGDSTGSFTYSVDASAVPSGATISGISVKFKVHYTAGYTSNQISSYITLGTKTSATVPMDGGSNLTREVTFGGSSETLGASVSDLSTLTLTFNTKNGNGMGYSWWNLDGTEIIVYYTEGAPNPNAPVTTKLYPNGVKNVGSFSNAANLVGSSQTAATNTLSLDAVASIYTDLLLNFSTIPAGAVISTVVAKVKAKTSASNTRRLANVLADAYYTTGGGSSKAFDLGSVQLTTTETTYSKSLTWAELTATIPEAKLRDANMVFGINVYGNGSTTTTATTTISGFWLEVTYTLPSGGVNALFLGEMF